jgi:hypothetical protein
MKKEDADILIVEARKYIGRELFLSIQDNFGREYRKAKFRLKRIIRKRIEDVGTGRYSAWAQMVKIGDALYSEKYELRKIVNEFKRIDGVC